MIKIVQIISLLFWLITFSNAPAAAITLYNGSGSVEEQGWLIYGQFPVAQSLLPPLPTPFAALAAKLTAPLAEGVGTSTLNTGDNNKGYSGYTNYQYTIPPLALESLTPSAKKLTEWLFSGSLELVNPDFPPLDRVAGFEIAFQVAISSESSKKNRAGFSIIAISQDGQGIELGFKEEKNSGRIFAQSEKFKEAEDTKETTLDLSKPTDYVLKIQGEQYSLLANGTEILSGPLRQYQFNPAKSQPKLPFNPYETPNFLFFGDDTDQARAHFTLGIISVDGAFAQVPELGSAQAFNDQGEAVTVSTTFAGGTMVSGEAAAAQATLEVNHASEAVVVGEIIVDPEHVGQVAEIVLPVVHSSSCGENEDEVFYMLDTVSNIIRWSGQLEELVAFRQGVILQPIQFVKMYDAQFPATGCIHVFWGYRLLEDGLIVANEKSLQVTVMP